MADFLTAQSYALANEGGYAVIDGDTYCGIARRFFPAWEGWPVVDAHKPLAHGQLIHDAALTGMINAFYKTNFWDKLLGDAIVSQPVATYCYDWYVNAAHNAVKEIQSALGIAADGIFGSNTLTALNAAGDILPALHTRRTAYYRRIATGPNAQYLTGWTNRADRLYERLV